MWVKKWSKITFFQTCCYTTWDAQAIIWASFEPVVTLRFLLSAPLLFSHCCSPTVAALVAAAVISALYLWLRLQVLQDARLSWKKDAITAKKNGMPEADSQVLNRVYKVFSVHPFDLLHTLPSPPWGAPGASPGHEPPSPPTLQPIAQWPMQA